MRKRRSNVQAMIQDGFADKLRHDIEVGKMTYREVAEKYDVGHGTVAKVCKQFGIKSRYSGDTSGRNNPYWKGGVRVHKGYREVYCPSHPFATKSSGVVLEHRLVAEDMYMRFLKPWEVVHHKNGNKLDNRPENLQVFSSNAAHVSFENKGRPKNLSSEARQKKREALLIPVDDEEFLRWISYEPVLSQGEVGDRMGLSKKVIARYSREKHPEIDWVARGLLWRKANRRKSKADAQANTQSTVHQTLSA